MESQIEAAEARRPNRSEPPKTPRQLRREEERAQLEFERTRVLHEIDASTHPRHRQMLEAGLRHLETRLAALTDDDRG